MEMPIAPIIVKAIDIDLVVERIFHHLDYDSMQHAEQAFTHNGWVIGNNSTRIWKDLLTRNVKSGLWRAAYERLQESSSKLFKLNDADYHRKLCAACHQVSGIMKNNWENCTFSEVHFKIPEHHPLHDFVFSPNHIAKCIRTFKLTRNRLQLTEVTALKKSRPFRQEVIDEFMNAMVEESRQPPPIHLRYFLTHKVFDTLTLNSTSTNLKLAFNSRLLLAMSKFRDGGYQLDYWPLLGPTEFNSIGRRSLQFRQCVGMNMFLDEEVLVLVYEEVNRHAIIEVRPTTSLEKTRIRVETKKRIISFDYHNGLMAVLSFHSSIRIFDLGTGKQVAKIKCQNLIPCRNVRLNSTYVAAFRSIQYLPTISLWNIEQLIKVPGRTVSPIEVPVRGFNHLCEMSDSEIMMSKTNGKVLVMDAFPTRSCLRTIVGKLKKCPKRNRLRKVINSVGTKTRSGRVTKPVVRYQV